MVRLWLEKYDLFPKGKLALITWYMIGLDLVLYVIEKVAAGSRPSYGSYLQGWIWFLSTIVAVLLLWLAKRWISANFLWRVRNRLIVTYFFIGVIPLVLVITLAGLVFWLLSGQFAAYVLKTRIDSILQEISTANRSIAEQIAADLRTGREVTGITTPRQPGWTTNAWLDHGTVFSSEGGAAAKFPAFLSQDLTAIVEDDRKIFLRSAVSWR